MLEPTNNSAQWYWPRFLYILSAAFVAAWGWNLGQLVWGKLF